jgi:hypothetical protein
MSRLTVSTSAALNIGWSSATMIVGEFTARLQKWRRICR